MDEGKIVKILLITLWLLFFVFRYFEIPFFGAIFLITVFLIIKFHKKEKNTFNEEFGKYKFDFNLRQYDQDSKVKKAFKNILMVLFYFVPLFIIIPYEPRELSTFDYLYILSVWALIFYLGSFYKLYNYYYFSKDFIKKPGKDFDKIFWTDVDSVEDKEKDEIFILHLKTGENIKFGSEIYYTLGKNKNEIIKYVRQLV